MANLATASWHLVVLLRTTVQLYFLIGSAKVLKRLLEPRLPGRDLPTSFEVAGHLAHLNLRDYLLPYKKLIGQVHTYWPCGSLPSPQ